jgi:hypothetical protein
MSPAAFRPLRFGQTCDPSGFIGDGRYYLGASKSYTQTPVCTAIPNPASPKFCAVLGVVGGDSVLIETIPQSSNSHSVAADAARRRCSGGLCRCKIQGRGHDSST